MLDFARLERGKASYHFAEGHLEEVVERALDVFRHRLEKEKLRLRTEIEANLPPVRMDEGAMTLVLLNLVDNAVKYAGDGGEVSVRLRRVPGRGGAVDRATAAPGIAPDEQRRIFERFYRADNARARNVRGSGIGLALVKHIAEAHGGRVEVESAPGRGSTFTVYVPAAPMVTPAPEERVGVVTRPDVTSGSFAGAPAHPDHRGRARSGARPARRAGVRGLRGACRRGTGARACAGCASAGPIWCCWI